MTNKTKIFINLPSIDESVCNLSVEFMQSETKHKITATFIMPKHLHDQLRDEVRAKYGTANNLHVSCVAEIGAVMGPAEMFRAAFDVAKARLYTVNIIHDYFERLFSSMFADTSIPVYTQLGVPCKTITKEMAADSSNMIFAFAPIFVTTLTQAPELLKQLPEYVQQTAVTFLADYPNIIITVAANTSEYSARISNRLTDDENNFLIESAKNCVASLPYRPTMSELHSIVVPEVSRKYLQGNFVGKGEVLEEQCNAALNLATKFYGLPELLQTYIEPKPKNILN